MFRLKSLFSGALLILLLALGATGQGRDVRPGVTSGSDLSSLPLPVSGYEVYLIGELHGVKETESIFAQYLARLNKEAGLRDVGIEEKAVYQQEAQDYIEGRTSTVPASLCLRAGILKTLRNFNERREQNKLIRVHLVDIDSPAPAIRMHLLRLKEQIAGSTAIHVPETSGIGRRGLRTVDDLKRLTSDERVLAELRTIRHSILAYRQGFEAGTGSFKGNPYMDDREEAIADNIRDLLRQPDCRAVLALYGSDHVSKVRRRVPDDKGGRDFFPMALRLVQSGVRVFSLVTFPLSGRTSWRGHEGEILWTAGDGSLAGGETLDRLVAAIPDATFFYIDPSRQKIRLPSQDVTAFVVDAFLLLASATAMENYCAK